MIKKIIAFTFLVLILSYNASSQEEHTIEYNEHEFKSFRVAFAIGHGYIPAANPNGENFLIIPTLGLDFQYWLNKKWGISLKSDLEISNYLVTDKSNVQVFVERENPFIVSLPILFNPWDNGLTFLAGPGIELEEHENFTIFRIGMGYEFEMAKHWDFEPEILYDLKDGHINSFTISFGVGKRF